MILNHRCHAVHCQTAVPPRMFMCRKHWFMIPKADQDRLWAVYVPGQERRRDPSDAYLKVAQELIKMVSVAEGLQAT